jgi:DNA-binding CsgD family transcriptional regulator
MSSAVEDVRLARLTPKEVACLRLVGQRMSSKEIASELGIAKTSVDTYCNRARAKLQVGGRQEAARLLRTATAADDGASAYGAATSSAARGALAPLTSATLRALGAGLVATLAYGALMAGLHALDAMKPPTGAAPHLTSGLIAPPGR